MNYDDDENAKHDSAELKKFRDVSLQRNKNKIIKLTKEILQKTRELKEEENVRYSLHCTYSSVEAEELLPNAPNGILTIKEIYDFSQWPEYLQKRILVISGLTELILHSYKKFNEAEWQFPELAEDEAYCTFRSDETSEKVTDEDATLMFGLDADRLGKYWIEKYPNECKSEHIGDWDDDKCELRITTRRIYLLKLRK